MPDEHVANLSRHRVAHIGTRYRFWCSCGAVSPLLAKDAAELARDRHLWEHGQIEEFRR